MDDFNTYLPHKAVGSCDSHFNKSSGLIQSQANPTVNEALTLSYLSDDRSSVRFRRDQQANTRNGSTDLLQPSRDESRQQYSRSRRETDLLSPIRDDWQAGPSSNAQWQDAYFNDVKCLTTATLPRLDDPSKSVRGAHRRVPHRTRRAVVVVGQRNDRRHKNLKCPVEGCDNTSGFTSEFERKRHINDQHPNVGQGPAFKCAIWDCNGEERLWRRKDHFRIHVMKYHPDVVEVETYINECTVPPYISEASTSQAEDVGVQSNAELAANEKFNKRQNTLTPSSPHESSEPVLKKTRRPSTRLPRGTTVTRSPASRQPHFAGMVMTKNDHTQVASVAVARPECFSNETQAPEYDAFQVTELVDGGDGNLEHRQGSGINTGQLSGFDLTFNLTSNRDHKGKGKERERSLSTDPSEAGSQPVVPPPKKGQRSFRCVYRHDPSKVKSQAKCDKPESYPSGLTRHHRTHHGLHYCQKCWKQFGSYQLVKDHRPCRGLHRCLEPSCKEYYGTLLSGPCPAHGYYNCSQDKYNWIYRLAHEPFLALSQRSEMPVTVHSDGHTPATRSVMSPAGEATDRPSTSRRAKPMPSSSDPLQTATHRVRMLEDIMLEFVHDDGSNYLYFRQRMETVLGQEAMERWRLASSYDTAPPQPGQVGLSESGSLLHVSTDTQERQHQQFLPAPLTHVAPFEFTEAAPFVPNDTFRAQLSTNLPSLELSRGFGAHFEAPLSNQRESWHASGFNIDRAYLNGASFDNVDWSSYQSSTDQGSAFGCASQIRTPVASAAPVVNLERNQGTSNTPNWLWGVRDQIETNNSFPPGFHMGQTTDDATTARTQEYESWSNGFQEDEVL